MDGSSFAMQGVAMGAAFTVAGLVSLAWLIYLEVGVGMSGDNMGAALPLALFSLTGLWLILKSTIAGRTPTTTRRIGVIAALFGLAGVIIGCGPTACFTVDRYFIGWFLATGIALAALAHHLVLTRIRRS